MRKKGCKTEKSCWKLEVVNQNSVIFCGEYSTLNEIANELGYTYNQVVEISNGRKKQPSGRYDTNYRFTKLSKILNKDDQQKIEEDPDSDELEETE